MSDERGADAGVLPEVMDEVTLDAELTKRLQGLDRLVRMLSRATHYQLLGLSTDASSDEVRAAYFQLARRYHPDAFFRKDIGPHRRSLEQVFAALTEAHETLRRPASRADYDRSIGLEPRVEVERTQARVPMVRPESEHDRVEREAHKLGVDALFEQPAPMVQHGALAASEPMASAGARAVRPANQRSLEELVQARARRRPEPAQPSAPAQDAGGPWAQSTQIRELEALKDLRKPRSLPPTTGVVAKPAAQSGAARPADALPAVPALAQEFQRSARHAWVVPKLRAAHHAEVGGQLAEAANILRAVVAQLGDGRIAAHLERLMRAAQSKDVPDQRARARAAEGERRWADAVAAWEAVIKLLPDDAQAHFCLARCLIAQGDLKAAGRAGVRAAELAPTHIETRELLVGFFERMGMKLNARREREVLERLLSAREAARRDEPAKRPGK